jgi:hypothetical protein
MSLHLLEPVNPQDPREQGVSHDARPAPELAIITRPAAHTAVQDEATARQLAKLDLMLMVDSYGYDAVQRWLRTIGACTGRVE